jgi:hypothetical protein
MTSIEHKRTRVIVGLRRAAFVTIATLLMEFGLGLFLFGTTPKSAHGATLFVAFGSAVDSGRVGLAIHAIVGSVLILGSVISLVRAIQTRAATIVILNAVAFAAIVLAWLAGADTVSDPMSGASRVMGIMTAIAILAYATVLWIAPRPTREMRPSS